MGLVPGWVSSRIPSGLVRDRAAVAYAYGSGKHQGSHQNLQPGTAQAACEQDGTGGQVQSHASHDVRERQPRQVGRCLPCAEPVGASVRTPYMVALEGAGGQLVRRSHRCCKHVVAPATAPEALDLAKSGERVERAGMLSVFWKAARLVSTQDSPAEDTGGHPGYAPCSTLYAADWTAEDAEPILWTSRTLSTVDSRHD